MFIPFFLIRLMDIFTTLLCMRKYGGWETIEANGFSGYLIHTFGFTSFIFINLALSALAYYIIMRFPRKISEVVMNVFILLNSIIVTSNMLIYVFI